MFRRALKSLLKDCRGGISGLIFETVMAAAVLSLLVTVVYLFRGNMEMIRSMAEREDPTEKLSERAFLPLERELVTGADVIAAIRYFSGDPEVEIRVSAGGRQKTYTAEDYDPRDFRIDYRDMFRCTCQYEGKVLKGIEFVQGN